VSPGERWRRPRRHRRRDSRSPLTESRGLSQCLASERCPGRPLAFHPRGSRAATPRWHPRGRLSVERGAAPSMAPSEVAGGSQGELHPQSRLRSGGVASSPPRRQCCDVVAARLGGGEPGIPRPPRDPVASPAREPVAGRPSRHQPPARLPCCTGARMRPSTARPTLVKIPRGFTSVDAADHGGGIPGDATSSGDNLVVSSVLGSTTCMFA
jgi:hypothetical protein